MSKKKIKKDIQKPMSAKQIQKELGVTKEDLKIVRKIIQCRHFKGENMKIVFEISGELEVEGLTNELDELESVVETLRVFGSADARYKIIVSKDGWVKL